MPIKTEQEILEELSTEYQKTAITAYYEGNYPYAITQLTMAIECNPQNAASYNYLGLIAYQHKNYLQAIKWFKSAIKCDSTNKGYSNNLSKVYADCATLYSERQQFDRTIDYCTRMIAINPENSAAYYQRSFAYYQQEKYSEALADLNKVLILDAKHIEAQQARDLVNEIMQQDNDLSLDHYFQVPLLHNSTHLRRLDNKQYNEVKFELRCMLAANVDPNHHAKKAIFYNNLGAIAYIEKKYPLAAKFFEKALVANKKMAVARENLVQTYLSLAKENENNPDEAIKYYSKIIVIDPENKNVYYNLGYAYHDKKNYDKAIENIEHALKLNPKNIAVYNELGCIYKNKAKLGKNEQEIEQDLDRSIKNFLEITKITSNHNDLADAYRNLGIMFLKKQNIKEANNCNAKAKEYFIKVKKDAFEKVKEHFEKVIQSKDDTKAHEALEIYKSTESHKEICKALEAYKSTDAYKRAYEFLELYKEACKSLGNLYYSDAIPYPDTEEEKKLALKCYEEIIADMPPQKPFIYNKIGCLHAELENSDIGIEYFLKTISEISNKNAMYQAYYYLGVMYAEYEEKYAYEVAIDYFKKAIQLKDLKNKQTYLSLLGDISPAAEEDKKLALECYKSIAASPELQDASLCIKIGVLHLKLQNYEKAIAAYLKALEKDPKNKQALTECDHARCISEQAKQQVNSKVPAKALLNLNMHKETGKFLRKPNQYQSTACPILFRLITPPEILTSHSKFKKLFILKK